MRFAYTESLNMSTVRLDMGADYRSTNKPPRVLRNNDGSWKKYIIEIYLFDEIGQYTYMYRMFTSFVHNKPISKNGLGHVPYKQHLLSKVVNSTRGYQKVLSLRHFPHSDSTMLHT